MTGKNSKNFNLHTFEEMMKLRESFAQNRYKEKIEISDHQYGNSNKLANTKQRHRLTVMDKTDELNGKQHERKMEQIKAVARGKGINV